MEKRIPRLMIAGTGSSCGKTTITCAILKVFKNRNHQISAFKCGPDYIDPMFHSRILEKPAYNLDAFFFDEKTLNSLLVKNGSQDINIIEGVMGFYDGLSLDSATASAYDIARMTRTPVILVLNAKGTAFSLLAQLQGFLSFLPENQITGVILNRCSPMSYPLLAKAISEHFGSKVKTLGYLPFLPDCALESRHLGLLTAQEISNLTEIIDRLALQAEKSLELDEMLRIANQAELISFAPVCLPEFKQKIRIAYASDKAFCFYYQDNLDIFQKTGAELIPFSPLTDRHLPDGTDGLYLGGGYPELYAETLSQNTALKADIYHALKVGIPCIAECGGFMYLTQAIDGHPMVGFLEGNCSNTGKLNRFGYITLKARRDNLLCCAGKEIRAHEFHYYDCENSGNAFHAVKPNGRQWDCAFVSDSLYAGFPHIHFYAKPEIAVNFYKACVRQKEKKHA